MELLHAWLRRTYRIEEPPRRSDRVRKVLAYDKDSGELVSYWLEGQRVPRKIVDRYFAEVPEAQKQYDHQKLHRDPRTVYLY